MSLIILAVIGVLLASIVTVLMVKYVAAQNLKCPHCQLEFVKDLFLIQDNTLLVCPFCHRWVLVVKSFDRYVPKKILS